MMGPVFLHLRRGQSSVSHMVWYCKLRPSLESCITMNARPQQTASDWNGKVSDAAVAVHYEADTL